MVVINDPVVVDNVKELLDVVGIVVLVVVEGIVDEVVVDVEVEGIVVEVVVDLVVVVVVEGIVVDVVVVVEVVVAIKVVKIKRI